MAGWTLMIHTTGNHVMKPIVEFTIAETRCRVVPAPVGDGHGHGDDQILGLRTGVGTGVGAELDAAQVIGTCALNGRRYLILGDTGSPQTIPAKVSTVVDCLTQRELQVAVLVCKGLGNKQIADRLRLSEWTVSSYLRRIFVKLCVRTRAAMVARVMAEVHD
jgi:DNA-binding CsgD family transcriptional regulator